MTIALADDFRRDARVIGVIGFAHMTSHFFQLVVPPLFPAIKDSFDVSYVALGALMTVYYAVSGLSQTVAGFAVDRFGARPVLAGGLALIGVSVVLIGLAPSYSAMVPAMVLAGVGNSVFHPADFAIMNASVSKPRIGRAYSVHGIAGSLGWVAAPAVVVGLSGISNWQTALMVVGFGAVAIAAFVWVEAGRFADHRLERAVQPLAAEGRAPHALAVLTSIPVLMCFAYFTLLSFSFIGTQTFAVTAFVQIFEAPLALATGALTAYFVGSAVGVFFGGFLADRTERHDVVAATGLLLSSLIFVPLALGWPSAGALPAVMALAGFCGGATGPSRDMLVRGATPAGSAGKVYGFVYSGLDVGSAIAPPMYGAFIDAGRPDLVFWTISFWLAVTIVSVVQVRRSTPRPLGAS